MELRKGKPFPFGATGQEEGVNFAVYAKGIEKISLCIFEETNLSQPLLEVELNPTQNKTGHVWHALIIQPPSVFAYYYRVNLTGQTEVTHFILDPYAKCVASDAVWHDQPSSDAVYRPLGKVNTQQAFDWGEDAPPNIPRQDLVIYEMHVRGFTHHSSSQVEHPGTYQGLIEKIPYLLDLGVNAIELMPIQEFNEQDVLQVNPETQQKLHNYFGYSTVNFFSPMNRYASRSDGDQTLIEFKTMVKELHKNGIEVILDVVFNHTAEGNEKGRVFSFKGLDPHTYYMINHEGTYLNFSGCGNTFNCNHPMTREFIVDALRYWVLEMHVDGFRFDLAPVFNRARDGTPLDNAPLIEALSHDPILASRKLIAEPWDAGGLYQLGGFAPRSPNWSEWNGKYRDVVRSFIKGIPRQRNAFAGVISGSHDLFATSRTPCSSINFVTAHDGFSLADLVSYDDKHNLANGEENRDGIHQNDSWNCGFEGQTDNKKVNNLRKKQVRNFHLALMISQGVPMILMGDEYAHTRHGNNNAWCQDNELNWFLWDQLEEHAGFYRYYRSLIHFRKTHPLLRRDTFFGTEDVKWHGLNPEQPDWDHDNHLVAFTLHFPSGEPGLYIAFNAAHIYQMVTLPSPGEGKAWQWVVNTNNPFPEDFLDDTPVKKLDGATFRMPPYSGIMLKV
jgi:isoamylase